MNKAVYVSPIGEILLEEKDGLIMSLNFTDTNIETGTEYGVSPALDTCIAELDAYFTGKLKHFTVGIKLEGTAFRRTVWDALQSIPYGATTSYGQIADNIGKPKASRAVGGANHNNPISIIVPCHRVVGANGSMTGYGGKIWRKEWLLAHEKKYLNME